MKCLTLWAKGGRVLALRDIEGWIRIPNKQVNVPTGEKVFLSTPPIDEQGGALDLLKCHFGIFIDKEFDEIHESLGKLRAYLESIHYTDLLLVVSTDSVNRKLQLSSYAMTLVKRVRVLEVSYPVSTLGPVLSTQNGFSFSSIDSRRKMNFPSPQIYEIITQDAFCSSISEIMIPVLQAYLKHEQEFFPKYSQNMDCLTVDYNILQKSFYQSELIPFEEVNDGASFEAPYAYSDSRSLNDKYGIVRKLRRIKNHDSLPQSLITIQADVADLRFATDWANNTVCQGSTFNDLESAKMAALGEGYERYCANIIDTRRLVVGSQKFLKCENINAIDPNEFILFSKQQLLNHSTRFKQFDESTITTWVDGKTQAGEYVYVPISMVYVNYRRVQRKGNYPIPLINSPAYAGISAGDSIESACINAFQEIIERHATMCWWHNPAYDGRTCIDTAEYPKIIALIDEFKQRGNEVSIVGISNRFRIPVYAVTLHNIENGIINTGFACRFNNEQAILKALTEACTLQAGSFDLLNPHGELFKAIGRKELSKNVAKPWIKSRNYLDYYSKDFSEMTDLMLQQQVYLDQRLFPRVERWLIPSHESSTLYQDKIFSNTRDEFDAYISKFSEYGLEPIIVDLTTKDVDSLGVKVVRVIVPGLIPNFAIGDIHLGKQALQNEPVLLGHQSKATPLAKLNLNPLPHC